MLNVNASMTGNLFDITFDGQSGDHRPQAEGAPGPLAAGNAGSARIPTPASSRVGALDLTRSRHRQPVADARRAARRARGDSASTLLPGSGIPCADPLAPGACENGYRESVVWADVDAARRPRDGPPSIPVRARRRRASAERAGERRRAVAACAAARRASPRAARASSSSGTRRGAAWRTSTSPSAATAAPPSIAPIRVSDNAPGTVAELNPTVAVRGGRVAVVWQEFADGRDDDDGRIKLARFDARGRKLRPDVRVDDADRAASGCRRWRSPAAGPS